MFTAPFSSLPRSNNSLIHGRYTNCYVHSMGGNSVLERNGILTPARIQMDPGNIIIREESRTKMLYIFIFPLYISRRIKSMKTKNRLVFY